MAISDQMEMAFNEASEGQDPISGNDIPVGSLPEEVRDDVPAMLSKNEFVMTADAVRGMGEGNVEKGAQKMYDQMKQLENRVV